jgi:hypothetical protein
MNSSKTILWRRLDTPGHDACSLVETPSGFTLIGGAAYLENEVPASLRYDVQCDRKWFTQRGHICGWIGSQQIDYTVNNTEDGWEVNGAPVGGLDECVDLDLKFTPATNLFQIQRAGLMVGEGAEVPVAWFDPADGSLTRLLQRYVRISANTHWYEAPGPGYRGGLEVDDRCFITRYPGLWESESTTGM